MEQPANLPLRFPSSPLDLRPSILEWQPYTPPHLEKTTVFENTPLPSASYEYEPVFPKIKTSKRPKNRRRKVSSLLDRQDSISYSLHHHHQRRHHHQHHHHHYHHHHHHHHRQDNIPTHLHTLVAGSSALLGALAVSIFTPGSFPTSTKKERIRRCPTNWRDATHVGLGCVWAGTKGGGGSF